MDESYFNIFINSALAKGDALAPLSLLLLFLARILPIIAQAPFFGAKVLPRPIKMIFALCLFLIFLPHLLAVMQEPVGFNLRLLLLILKEFFIGLLIGFIISLPFSVVQSAGIIIDHQRGGASLMVNDPTIQNQSSPLGTLFNYVLIWLFFEINAPFMVIETVMTSYTFVPPDKFFSPEFFVENSAFWTIQVSLLNKVMKLSIQLATPALLAILMTDAFLGIANRLAPQVQITFLGMPLKSLLGLLLVCLGFKIFNAEVVKEVYMWIDLANDMIKLFVTA